MITFAALLYALALPGFITALAVYAMTIANR